MKDAKVTLDSKELKKMAFESRKEGSFDLVPRRVRKKNHYRNSWLRSKLMFKRNNKYFNWNEEKNKY